MRMKRTSILFAASALRVVLTYLLLHRGEALAIPAAAKILIATTLFDTLDCGVPRALGLYAGRSNANFCHTATYQLTDKITDLLCYVVIWHWVRSQKLLPARQLTAVTLLLVHRAAGVIALLVTRWPRVLFYFPNVFEGAMVVLVFASEFRVRASLSAVMLVLAVAVKVVQEYTMHYSRSLTTQSARVGRVVRA